MRKILKIIAAILLIPQICFASSRTFNGTNQKLQDSSSPVTAYAQTLQCFFSKTDTTSAGTFLTDTDTAANADWFRISADATGHVLAQVNHSGGGNFQSSTTTATFSATTWALVSGVFTSTASRDIYLDAANKVSNTTATTAPAGIDVLAAGVLARAAPTEWYAGDMAYCATNNVALSLYEIEEFRWKPEIGAARGIKALWPMWGESPEQDLSGNANTGTVTGSTTSTNGPPVMFGEGMPL